MTIGDLNLSVRAYNGLDLWFKEHHAEYLQRGIRMDDAPIGLLTAASSTELLRIKSLGILTLREIQELLAVTGHWLCDFPARYPMDWITRRDTENMPLDARDKIDLDSLEIRFRYHAPHGDQKERYQALRGSALEFAKLIVGMCPSSAERSTALTHLDACVMFANAAIARHEMGGEKGEAAPEERP
jgi:hypothetical protein